MTNLDNVHYRLANSADADAIATLHAESWRSAYRGMIPDSYLDHDVFDDRAMVWRERFAEADGPPAVTIVAELVGTLAGFAHSIIDEDAQYGTLLDNLHVRPDIKRLGIGRRLVAETAAWLEARGNENGLHLWVFEANAPARNFYDALGGRAVGKDISHTAGSSEPALRYYWPELALLSLNLPKGRRALA
jgi:GNAT superfamily N-acetyltransferase